MSENNNETPSKSITPRVGVGVAILRGNQILLIKRKKSPEADCWGLIGGKIDAFETSEDAIIRETKEELDIIISDPFLLCISDLFDENLGYHWVSPIYLVTEFTGTPKITEPDKHWDFGWFDLSSPPAPLTKAVTDAIAALREK